MEWTHVDNSSNIAAFRYDEDSRTLEVRFLNGSTYQYFDVHVGAYNDLLNPAEGSYGKAFNRCIKGHFRYARL